MESSLACSSKTLKQQTFLLTFQFTDTPMFLLTLMHIETDFKWIFQFQNLEIMTPSQYVRQRLTFLIE